MQPCFVPACLRGKELGQRDMLLSYVARLCLVHRWAMLDGERGREMFRKLVSSLGAGDKIAEAEKRYAEER